VEEFTQSLIQLAAEKGMDWLYANCSTTAQRGALDWKGKFRETVAPLFADLYQKVADGTEAKIVLEKNSQPDYREKLDAELAEMGNSECGGRSESTGIAPGKLEERSLIRSFPLCPYPHDPHKRCVRNIRLTHVEETAFHHR
jgi:hypothetical protein